jgi:hypothetical protein
MFAIDRMISPPSVPPPQAQAQNAPAKDLTSPPPTTQPTKPAPPAPPTPAERVASCKGGLQCLTDQFLSEASVYCRESIERLARFQHEWTDGFFEQKFSRSKWKDRSKSIVTFMGDRIKFQNGFGAWQTHLYECDFDLKNWKILGARAAPGRI